MSQDTTVPTWKKSRMKEGDVGSGGETHMGPKKYYRTVSTVCTIVRGMCVDHEYVVLLPTEKARLGVFPSWSLKTANLGLTRARKLSGKHAEELYEFDRDLSD